MSDVRDASRPVDYPQETPRWVREANERGDALRKHWPVKEPSDRQRVLEIAEALDLAPLSRREVDLMAAAYRVGRTEGRL